MDGICPPSLRMETLRRVLHEELEGFCNENAWKGDGNGESHRIRASDELEFFLKYADGVEDPDFRSVVIPGWSFSLDVLSRNLMDEEIPWARELMRVHLRRMLVDVKEYSWQYDGFEVKLLFKCRVAADQYGYQINSYYGYCRRIEKRGKASDEGEDSQGKRDAKTDDWGWRIFFTPFGEDGVEGPVFEADSIVDLLAWYGSWAERVDIEKVRRYVQDDYFRIDISSESY
jgi:hypothetical protein